MSVVLKIAVPDGVVLGADSRSTSVRDDQKAQVFDGVQKVFVLHKDYPAAVMAWGMNRLGGVSLEQLMIEVRQRLEGPSCGQSVCDADPRYPRTHARCKDLGWTPRPGGSARA